MEDKEAMTAGEGEAKEEKQAMLGSLRLEERERERLLQELLATAEQPRYGARQRSVGQKLGMTDRSERRLLRHLREEGVESVVRRNRSDCPGEHATRTGIPPN